MADIDELIELLRAARKTLVFIGAGISTPSGIRDFRGPKGIWKERQPIYYDQFMNSEAARIEYWDYKAETWPTMRDAEPNAVHESLVDLDRAGKLLMVVTQNVDGLHRRAGLNRGKLIELHGSNRLVECQSCHEETDPDPHFEYYGRTGKAPVCHCGGFLKPATISLGQSLRPTDLQAAAGRRRRKRICGVAWFQSVIHPAQSPLIAARRSVSAVVNGGSMEHDGFDEISLRLEGDVSEIFLRPSKCPSEFTHSGSSPETRQRRVAHVCFVRCQMNLSIDLANSRLSIQAVCESRLGDP